MVEAGTFMTPMVLHPDILIYGYIFEENNPSGIKAVFQALNLCDDTVRLPLVPATDALKQKIKDFVETY